MSLTLIRLMRYLSRAAICNLESWLGRRFIDTRNIFFLSLIPEAFFQFLSSPSFPSLFYSLLVLIASPFARPGFDLHDLSQGFTRDVTGGHHPLLTAWEWRPGGPLMATPIALTLSDGNGRVSAKYGRISDVNPPPPLPFSSPPPPPLPSFSSEGSGGLWWLKPQLVMAFRFLGQWGRRHDRALIVTSP